VDEKDIKKEATWALSNCTEHAEFSQISALVDKGIIKSLLEGLKMDELKVLAVALEGLENILR
jgi:importin subunit alpha-6/7